MSVRVRNIGDEQRTFEQSSQYLFDTAGRRYETGDAGLYLVRTVERTTTVERTVPGRAPPQ